MSQSRYSHSQSHSGLSQITTQDFFTQTQNMTLPQNEQVHESDKKMSMYERWINKRQQLKALSTSTSQGEMFALQGSSRHQTSDDSFSKLPKSTSRPSGSCHMDRSSSDPSYFSLKSVNNTKANELRESLLLEHILKSLEECNSEVKTVLHGVKEKLEDFPQMSEEQLSQTIKSFLEDIEKHEERMLLMIQQQSKESAANQELEKKVAMRDSRIEILEAQLEGLRKDDTFRFAVAVKNQLRSPQLALEQKLQEILEWTKDTKEQQTQLFSECKHTINAQSKQCIALSKSGEKNIKELERRIISELDNLCQEFEKKQRDTQNDTREETERCLRNHLKHTESMIIQQMKTSVIQLKPNELNQVQQENVIQEAVGKQLEMLNETLLRVMSRHLNGMEQQLCDIQDTVAKGINNIMKSLPSSSQACDMELCNNFDDRHSSHQLQSQKSQISGDKDKGISLNEHFVCSGMSCNQLNLKKAENSLQSQYVTQNSLKSFHRDSDNDQQTKTSKMKSTMHKDLNSSVQTQLSREATHVAPVQTTFMKPYGVCASRRVGPSPVAAVMPQQQGNQLMYKHTTPYQGSKQGNQLMYKHTTPYQGAKDTMRLVHPRTSKRRKSGLKRIYSPLKKTCTDIGKNHVREDMPAMHRDSEAEPSQTTKTRPYTRNFLKMLEASTFTQEANETEKNIVQCSETKSIISTFDKNPNIYSTSGQRRDRKVEKFNKKESDQENLNQLHKMHMMPMDTLRGASEHITLTSFIKKSSREPPKPYKSNSEASSPATSFSEILIQRKIRTPLRRNIDVKDTPRWSPCSTWISEINQWMGN